MTGNVYLTYDRFPELARALPGACGRIVWRTANELRKSAMQRMEGPKGGRLYRKGAIRKSYKVGGSGFKKWKGSGAKFTLAGGRASTVVGYKTHRASAPGEAPAIDTGNLRGSISVAMTSPTSAMVSVGSEHGIYLEYGTRKMAKRPYIRPAVDEVKVKFLRALQDLEREMGKGA